MIVRVFEGVATHFPARRSEWLAATMMVGWGRIVAASPDLFDTSPAYRHMANMADESAWAFWATVIGAVRLAALFVNGTFHDKWYSLYSPHVRAVLSFATCFLWCQISLGLYGSGSFPPGLAIFPALAVNDLLNGFSGWNDAGKAAKASQHDAD